MIVWMINIYEHINIEHINIYLVVIFRACFEGLNTIQQKETCQQ